MILNRLDRLPQMNTPRYLFQALKISCLVSLTWGFPKMLVPNNHGVFLLKMISTWGVKWGYHRLRKHPHRDADISCFGASQRLSNSNAPCTKTVFLSYNDTAYVQRRIFTGSFFKTQTATTRKSLEIWNILVKTVKVATASFLLHLLKDDLTTSFTGNSCPHHLIHYVRLYVE